MERRVQIRFKFAVDVHVPTAWVESHSMAQIEDQARKEAEAELARMLDEFPHIRLVGKLGYEFTLAGKSA